MKFLLILFFQVLCFYTHAQQLIEYKVAREITEDIPINIQEVFPLEYPGRQSIVNFDINVMPCLVTSQNGKLYMKWQVDQFKDVDSLIAIAQMIVEDDINYSAPGLDTFHIHPFEIYLNDTPNINFKNRNIVKLSKRLIGGGQKQELNRISNYIKDHIEFDETSRVLKASRILKKSKGSLVGMTHLTMALARSMGIPIRTVSGYAIEKVGYEHIWMEVYNESEGWTPYDPYYKFLYHDDTSIDYVRVYKNDIMVGNTPKLNSPIYFGEVPKDYGNFVNVIRSVSRMDGLPISPVTEQRLLRDINWRIPKLDHLIPQRKVTLKNVSLQLAMTIENYYFKDELKEGRTMLDSLSMFSPNYFEYIYWNSLYKIREGRTDDALKSIQYLMKMGKGKTQKDRALYAFALYHAANENAQGVIKALSVIKTDWLLNEEYLLSEPILKTLENDKELIKFISSLSD